jgi:hypothetical protein
MHNSHQARFAQRGQSSKKHSVYAAITLFAVLLMQLSVRLSITERAYQLEERRESILAKDILLRETKLDLAKTIDPIFLKRHARQRLQMGVTPPQRIRQIETGRVR